MINAEQLNAIKERVAKAMPGPWYRGEGYEQMCPGYYVASEANGLIVLAEEEGILRDEDVQFIAHAREDVPALIAEVERYRDIWYHGLGKADAEIQANLHVIEAQQQENARLREALEFYADFYKYNYGGDADAMKLVSTSVITKDGGHIAREALKCSED